MTWQSCVSCDTVEQAYEDHDRVLEALLLRCKERGIALKKRELSSGSVTESRVHWACSAIITDNDLERDPDKIEAIKEMPKSQILEDAQRLNSFATYLSKFMPELLDGMNPLSPFFVHFLAVGARLRRETS